ncbi:hypothetical protein [Clostridium sp. AM58-1XD]|uniref:hypothetical protein n=1 Tax=Clostridium sp. AM58-1XD TaxID=2292307 RepID=UPI000E46FA20|nr:hypothetical protein [Clostridium sp. AM58-1XD]RGY97708.1 hypothetical protein DXA13_13540 [Clostridium sp. AM58-1XD]
MQQGDAQEKKQRGNNSSYMFRLVIGAYLVYMAYGLVKEMLQGTAPLSILTAACTVLFGVVGTLLVVVSGRRLYLSRRNEEDGSI